MVVFSIEATKFEEHNLSEHMMEIIMLTVGLYDASDLLFQCVWVGRLVPRRLNIC